MQNLMHDIEVGSAVVAMTAFWGFVAWTVLFGNRQSATVPARISPRSGLAPSQLLPARYRGRQVSSAPMGGAAELVYDADGKVAWTEVWTDFCDLAWAGGPPHRDTLLSEGDSADRESHPEDYARAQAEIERGLTMITSWPVNVDAAPGAIGLECPDVAAADWMWHAIRAENVAVRTDGQRTLLLPVASTFRTKYEVKNVITAVAKTHHYWTEHRREIDASRRGA